MKVLILDNYDSFVWNLADYVGKLGADPLVVRSTKLTVEEVLSLEPERIIISPGPGHPSEKRFTGVSGDIIRSVSREVPTLGVCMGMQLMDHVFGGSVVRARRVFHGKPSKVHHSGEGIFKGLENPLTVGRYHSLVVREQDLPKELEVVAREIEDGELMALIHRSWPLVGVQFHPESILTPKGIEVVRNFLRGEL